MSATMLMLGVFAVSANASQNYELCNTLMMASPNYAAPDGDGDETPAPTWIEVELASAGSLGVEVLYQDGINTLGDVDYLKVKGTLNDADWTSLKNMSNLKGLDLREASFEGIPNNEFQNRTSLCLVYLPEGMKTIGNSAFSQTAISAIEIPSSVTSIGTYAFSEAKSLTEVSFPKNSVLQSIGENAFYYCTSLAKFLMPNTVTSLGYGCFYYCSALSNLSLSSSLTQIPSSCFYHNTSLKNVLFPENLQSIGYEAFEYSGLENVILPVGLTYLDYRAFGNCKSLKYIELPSYNNYYYYTFESCTALETIVCPSCTPPAISGNPFSNVNRSNITLKVPSFAVNDYKLDTYWLNFGTIEAMDTDPSFAIISGNLSLTNNRRPNGVLDMSLYTTGSVTVGGDAPLEIGDLTFHFDPYNSAYSRFVNKGSNTTVSVNGLMNFFVRSERWYFISPFADVNLSDITHAAGGSFVFRFYNGQYRAENGVTSGNKSWQNVAEDGTLKAGQGYICRSNKEGYVNMPITAANMTAALTPQNITTELTAYAAENTANANWNYVGNPYPCYYDAYYMDFTAPFTVWDSNSSTYKAYSVVDDNYVFRPMEAFFVQKPDELSSILFKEEGRQIESTINRVATTRNALASSTARQLYDILLTDGIHTDETRTIINEKASLGYELTRDAAKFMSMDEKVPQIYSIDEAGNLLAFNERPLDNGKVRLGFYAGESGAYTLKGSPSCSENVKVYDAVTGIMASLGKDGYHFTVEAGGTYNDRFTLMFSDSDITSIESAASAETQVSVVAGGIEVRPASASEISVYDAAGHQVAYAKAVSGRTFISLSSGLYLVKISGKTYKCVVL